MANETIMQGLLESLMQRPQDTTQQRGVVLANLISQPNPLAATAAYMLPQQLENVGGAARGLFGLKAPETPQMAIQKAITANPGLLNSSAGLAKLAQAATASGDSESALRLSAMSAQLAAQEQAQAAQLAKEERESGVKQAQTSAQRMAQMQQVEAALQTATTETARRALTGLRTQVMAGNYDGKDVVTPLKTILEATAAPQPTATGMDQKDIAALYKDFTPESVRAYLTNPSAALVPIAGAEKAPPASVQEFEYAKQAGYPGSYTDFLGLKSASTVATTMSPVQQVTLMNDQLQRIPTVDKTAADLSQLQQIKQSLPLLDQSNPQAFTLITASLPQLYGSNSRAQAEIDAFRARKGITESLGDWVTLAAGGSATKETKENLKEIINILDANITAQRMQEVQSVANGFKGAVDDTVLSKWVSNQMMGVSDDIDSIVNKALGQ